MIIEQEGLVFSTTSYQDNSIIGQLLTQRGVYSFIYTKSKQNYLAPLVIGDFTLIKSPSSGLFKVKEFHLLNTFLDIRQSFSHLQAAGSILRALKKTQLEENPSPLLYALTKAYLFQFKAFKHPEILEISFLLKLMKYEGILNTRHDCSSCQNKPISHLDGGLFLCHLCASKKAQPFTQEEFKLFLTLAHSQSFQDLKNLTLSQNLLTKLKQWYKDQPF